MHVSLENYHIERVFCDTSSSLEDELSLISSPLALYTKGNEEGPAGENGKFREEAIYQALVSQLSTLLSAKKGTILFG